MPASRMRSRAPSSALLMLSAPCDPPLTRRVGRSGSSPNCDLASAAVSSGVGDRAAHRHADQLSSGHHRLREGRADVAGLPRADLVCDPWQLVRLVHDDRDPAQPGGEVGGDGDVAAEPDEHVGLRLPEHLACLAHGAGQGERELEQVEVDRARKRDRIDQLQFETGLGDDPRLETLCGADAHDRCIGALLDGPGGGDQRGRVSRRSSPGQHDAGHVSPPWWPP